MISTYLQSNDGKNNETKQPAVRGIRIHTFVITVRHIRINTHLSVCKDNTVPMKINIYRTYNVTRTTSIWIDSSICTFIIYSRENHVCGRGRRFGIWRGLRQNYFQGIHYLFWINNFREILSSFMLLGILEIEYTEEEQQYIQMYRGNWLEGITCGVIFPLRQLEERRSWQEYHTTWTMKADS